jgi:hypothetical protein
MRQDLPAPGASRPPGLNPSGECSWTGEGRQVRFPFSSSDLAYQYNHSYFPCKIRESAYLLLRSAIVSLTFVYFQPGYGCGIFLRAYHITGDYPAFRGDCFQVPAASTGCELLSGVFLGMLVNRGSTAFPILSGLTHNNAPLMEEKYHVTKVHKSLYWRNH